MGILQNMYILIASVTKLRLSTYYHLATSSCTIKFIYSEKATKFCEIFTLFLFYVVPVKSKVKISKTFVAFLECMNFIPNLLVDVAHVKTDNRELGYCWQNPNCAFCQGESVVLRDGTRRHNKKQK